MSIKQNQALRERIRHITESKPFSIHRTVFTSDWELALYQHWHPEFEFFYLVKGEVQFQVEAKTLHLHAGEAVFLRPYLLHRAQRMDEHGGIFNAFVFSPTFLSDTISEQHYELYEAENSIITGQNNIILIRDDSNWERAILENLRDIYQCHMLPLHDCELRIRGRFLIIWQEFINHCFQFTSNQMHKKYKKQLQPVFKYISEYYSESLRLSQLSDLVFLSREQFCRLFKKTTGLTPFEYLNRFRIQKSCEYLAKTDFKIAEIAILSGFNNISYFNRVFKKYRELSPGDYRNTSATIQASRKSAPNS